ncbi:MAG: hypothetical protein IJ343_10755 [Clostridia bacterium]|nr:hypothetical protein [Clostridia bacterium]
MTNQEMLQAYRAAVIDLEELSVQLNRTGLSGAPQGIRSMAVDLIPGTNNPAAAALQAADGIEELINRKRNELAALAENVGPLIGRIGSYRTYVVIQQYYLRGMTDSDIAKSMCISRTRVNQIRNDFLASVS